MGTGLCLSTIYIRVSQIAVLSCIRCYSLLPVYTNANRKIFIHSKSTWTQISLIALVFFPHPGIICKTAHCFTSIRSEFAYHMLPLFHFVFTLGPGLCSQHGFDSFDIVVSLRLFRESWLSVFHGTLQLSHAFQTNHSSAPLPFYDKSWWI